MNSIYVIYAYMQQWEGDNGRKLREKWMEWNEKSLQSYFNKNWT